MVRWKLVARAQPVDAGEDLLATGHRHAAFERAGAAYGFEALLGQLSPDRVDDLVHAQTREQVALHAFLYDQRQRLRLLGVVDMVLDSFLV